jgi:lipopolysaccharide transport system permease protein
LSSADASASGGSAQGDVQVARRRLEPAAARRGAPQVLVIRPRRAGMIARLREFFAYRRLLPYFARRNVQQRYARTYLGWLWLPLRPSIDVVTSSLIFGGVLGVGTGNTPYLIFFLVASGAWQFFSQTAYFATRSIQMNRSLSRRVYIPRLVPLVSSLAFPLAEFIIYLAIAGVALGFYVLRDGVFYLQVGPATLIALAGLALLSLQGLVIGLWLSPFAALFRDVRFGLGYVLGFSKFLTPVIYPLSSVPSSYRTLASLNPITAPIEMTKYGFFHGGEIGLASVASSLSLTFAFLIRGLWFFSRKVAVAVDYL